MLQGMADGFGAMFWLALIQLPLAILGLWKLAEIILWFWHHIRWVG